MHLIKLSGYYAVSVFVAYTLASFAHTQQVLARLKQLGVHIALKDRLVTVRGRLGWAVSVSAGNGSWIFNCIWSHGAG